MSSPPPHASTLLAAHPSRQEPNESSSIRSAQAQDDALAARVAPGQPTCSQGGLGSPSTSSRSLPPCSSSSAAPLSFVLSESQPSRQVDQAVPSLPGHAEPATGSVPAVASPSPSLGAHLDPLVSPTQTTFGRVDDPVTTLGGRRTPFFMLAPQGDDPVRDPSDLGLESRAVSELEQTAGQDMWSCESVLDTHSRDHESGNASPQGTSSTAPSPATGDRLGADGPKGTEVDDMLGFVRVVARLDSQVDRLTELCTDLSERVRVLEEAVSTGPRGYFPDPRPQFDPLAPRFGGALPPHQQPRNPSPFRPPLPNEGYWAEEDVYPNTRPYTENELTPPASPQVQVRMRLPLSRTSSTGASSERSAIQRPGVHARTLSHGQLQFSPLAGRARSTSASSFVGQAGPPGWAEDIGDGHSAGYDTSAVQHLRSLSLGDVSFQNRSFTQRPLEPPNYRVLLETDAMIDSESFVCRLLAHNDQQCSLFLQQRVRNTTPEKRQEVFDAVGRHVLDLSLSKFGNFLVSRCLESGDSAVALAYEDALADHLLRLSLDLFGCHVVQKLLDCGGPTTKDRVLAELLPHPQVLKNKSSLHVINRILTTPNPPALFQRLADLGAGSWATIVQEDGGSLVVQHLLEDWSETPTSSIARDILDAVGDVAQTPSGSVVVSNLLERNPLPFCTKIMQHAPQLAASPHGAKVVERCLRAYRAGPAGISAFVDAVCTVPRGPNPPLLVAIASHAAGAQLLVNLLTGTAAALQHKDTLGRAVLRWEGLLLRTAGPYGARVVGLCRNALVAAGGGRGYREEA